MIARDATSMPPVMVAGVDHVIQAYKQVSYMCSQEGTCTKSGTRQRSKPHVSDGKLTPASVAGCNSSSSRTARHTTTSSHPVCVQASPKRIPDHSKENKCPIPHLDSFAQQAAVDSSHPSVPSPFPCASPEQAVFKSLLFKCNRRVSTLTCPEVGLRWRKPCTSSACGYVARRDGEEKANCARAR